MTLIAAISIAATTSYIISPLAMPFMEGSVQGFSILRQGLIIIALSLASMGAGIYWLTSVTTEARTIDAIITAVGFSIVQFVPIAISLIMHPSPMTLSLNLMHFLINLAASVLFGVSMLKNLSSLMLGNASHTDET